MNLTAHRDETTGRWFMEGVEPETETYQRILEMLKTGINFKFARYGDGEIYCMTGKAGHNTDGHQYFPELGARLRQAVTSGPIDYMVGIQPLSVSHLPEQVEIFFGNINPLFNADVLHSASIDGQLSHFFKALEGRYIILVGPAHLAGMFDGSVHVVIPSRDCWLHYQQIKEQLEFHLVKDCAVLLCASMMSEVLIDDMKDYECSIIDAGSVLDPYAGVNSRKYHHKLEIK